MVLGGVAGYRYHDWKSGATGAPQSFNLINTQQPQEFQNVDFSQFWQVWKILQTDYLEPDKVKPDQMVYGAIKGMTASLDDPYTVYLPPAVQKRSAEDLQGSFFGIGAELGVDANKTLMVTVPLKGSPAAQAGMKSGDLILHVKDTQKNLDQDTTNWSLDEAVNNIRGDKGTSVILTLMRPSDLKRGKFDLTVQRDEIKIPSLELTYVTEGNKKFAHIVISRFGEQTDQELSKATDDILGQSAKVNGIILDLRNNPGGFLDQAVNIASDFIKSGVIVTQKGKFSSQDYQAKGGATPRLADFPIVVLVNRYSASAAEIVAGALRDQRNAKLVGETTFGKGTVQDARQLDNGAGLHVTVARWLLPKGDWINKTGIPVSVQIQDDPTATQDAVLQRGEKELAGEIR